MQTDLLPSGGNLWLTEVPSAWRQQEEAVPGTKPRYTSTGKKKKSGLIGVSWSSSMVFLRGKGKNSTRLPNTVKVARERDGVAGKMYWVLCFNQRPFWNDWKKRMILELPSTTMPKKPTENKPTRRMQNPTPNNRSKQIIAFSHYERAASSATTWTSGAKSFVVYMETLEIILHVLKH